MDMFIKRRPVSAPKLDPFSGHSNSRKCIDIETKFDVILTVHLR